MIQNVTVNIYSGNWVVDVANVQLDDGAIVDVQLQYGNHQPVNASTAESQRKFWTQEYARLNWSTTPLDMVAKAIGTLLLDNNATYEPEDYWLEAQYEDRYVLCGF